MLSSTQAIEVGDWLMHTAEELQDFPAPACRAKIALGGKQWMRDHTMIEAYPWRFDGKDVSLTLRPLPNRPQHQMHADVSPGFARQLGAYLLDLGLRS